MTREAFAELVRASVPGEKAGKDWLAAHVGDPVNRKMWRHALRIVWNTYREIHKTCHEEDEHAD